MSHPVFVFGTLKEGFPNFATNKGARIAGDFITVERYPLYLVGERFSPWLIDAAGEGERVVGQVFEVDAATLAAMDELERITERDGYRRVMLDVEPLADGRGPACRVQAYVKPREQFAMADARLGPLQEYTREHAALYRRREAPGGGPRPPSPMTDFEIYTPTAEEVHSGELGRRMRQFNYRFVGEYGQVQPVWVSAKDGAGGLVGGLRGFVFLHWLNVELLFVDEAARHQGVGRRLLDTAEQKARALGARNATLNTFEWQARAFYLKQGYEEFGRIDDYVEGFYAAYMKKALGP